MDPLATRSQPETGVLRNPIPQSQQQSQFRPQVTSNVNKPLQQQPIPQQTLNYQQPQYRLPSPGQQQQTPLSNQPPLIRPPLAPNIRPLINPQQAPNIRNLPPQQQQIPIRPPQQQNPQFRPQQSAPPSQHQGFPPRLPFQPPIEQQQQFRPPQVPLQRPPEPQKIIRPPPLTMQTVQSNNNNNMMSEMNREKTFTTNNNNNGEQTIDDDDDDVVVGRLSTPQNRNGQKPVESLGVVKENIQQRQIISPQADEKQRRESVQSIPSRPPSGLGSNQSASPEPRSPGVNQNQHQTNSNNRPDQINRQGDYMRDSNDYDKVQRPMPSRQSPEDINRSKMTPQQQQLPLQQKPIPPQQQPHIQDHLPFMKPNFTSEQQQQQQQLLRKEQETRKSVALSDMKKSIDLDLGKSTTNNTQSSLKNHTPKGDNDSGVDESTQEKDKNGTSPISPLKSPSKIPSYQPRPASITPKTRSRSTSKQRLSLLKQSPDEPPFEPLIKKVPMNKIEVGNAPSPNLKKVTSKIGSLENATHKPGGGNVKIESKKIDIKAAPRIDAKNDKYAPKGGEKKIISQKLQWNAKSKIGSLENASHKPGGGDKRIVEIKTDFKEKAKPKVGSKDNMGYVPGGGDVKARDERAKSSIVSEKLDIKAESKIGSLDNVKHRPGGGEKKIFDDKEYLRNVEHPVPISPPSQSPLPSGESTGNLAAKNNLVDLLN